jgi:hypothetical protein
MHRDVESVELNEGNLDRMDSILTGQTFPPASLVLPKHALRECSEVTTVATPPTVVAKPIAQRVGETGYRIEHSV